jgi:hypothetical protein
MKMEESNQDPTEVLVSRKEYRRLHRLSDRARFIATTDRKYRLIQRKELTKSLNLAVKSASKVAPN